MRDWLIANAPSFVIALVVGAGVALVALNLRAAPPPIEVRPSERQATAVPSIYIHVDGAVEHPGVYELAGGARVFEAIEAAGGAREEANLRELNLAARVADGQKLVIPAQPEPAPEPGALGGAPAAPAPTPPPSAAVARINVNTATERILETLPGIGPVTARRIVEHRQANGPFTSIEQLRESRLVNASTFERIRSLISTE